jgi:hypothetical protein
MNHISLDESDKESLQEVIDLFDQAESKVKELERLCGELSIPSINQLRYVGYHLTKALCHDDNPSIFTEEIKKSKSHAKRAIYDTYEAGILYLLEKIEDFQFQASTSSQTNHVLPNYSELCAKAQASSDFLQKVRLEHKQREKYYLQCEPHIDILKNIYTQFKVSAPLIVQKELEALNKDKKETRKFLITITISSIGVLFAFTLLLFKIFKS